VGLTDPVRIDIVILIELTLYYIRLNPHDSIELLPDGSYKRTKKNKTVYIYDFYGQLQSITDANGNNIAFGYSAARELTGFTDSVGRSMVVSRSGGKIDTVTYYTTELPVPIIRQFNHSFDCTG
jgi:YD repeat-containing protein